MRSHTHYNNNNYYSTNNCAFVVTDMFIDNQVASVYQKILVGFKVLVLQISYLNNNTIIILSDDYDNNNYLIYYYDIVFHRGMLM